MPWNCYYSMALLVGCKNFPLFFFVVVLGSLARKSYLQLLKRVTSIHVIVTVEKKGLFSVLLE